MSLNENELLELIKQEADTRSRGLKKQGTTHTNQSDTLGELPFRIVGGASKDFYGATLCGKTLSTKGLQGITSYEPSELYITVKSGTPFTEVESVLAQQGQYLPFEAPNFNGLATVGGVIAAGLSGPARATSGGVRDYVLGLKVINGRGEHLSFGGQVIKNVAGYDVSRVFSGSFGTLGLITEVSLKVLPTALAEKTLVLQITQQGAIELLNAWGATALPLNASVWQNFDVQGNTNSDAKHLGGQLWVRLRGAIAAVKSGEEKVFNQCATLGLPVEAVESSLAKDFWTGHKNQTHHFYQVSSAERECLWRLSVPQKTHELKLKHIDPTAAQCIEWNGAQRWLWAASEDSDLIKSCASSAGGHATLWRASINRPEQDKAVGVFTAVSEVQRKIQKALQQEFDPYGMFDTGRLEI